MSDIFLSPPFALLLYLGLAGVLSGIGRSLVGPSKPSSMKSATYASGEAPPAPGPLPGYRPFFVIALFFAVLHLGVLVLASGGLAPIAGIYLAGLMLTLLALALG
jgi:NADH:ubiquinone oxidoreductase subunit 3 (subunit A)